MDMADGGKMRHSNTYFHLFYSTWHYLTFGMQNQSPSVLKNIYLFELI